MDTLFMHLKNSKTSDPHKLIIVQTNKFKEK